MLLILNNDNIDVKDLIIQNNKLCFYLKENKMNGLYFKYAKQMIIFENKYYLQINEKIIPIFEKLKIKDRLKYIDSEYYIYIIKNDTTTKIYEDDNEYLILSFKSINDNNYIKIHISQWNVQD
jgi:hypothetical protein